MGKPVDNGERSQTMSYAQTMAAALSGATMGQLGYWRRTGVLGPEIRDERPIRYSFRDIIALRSFVFLREAVSLQKIRVAVTTLRGLGEIDHLSSYSMVSQGDSISVQLSDTVVDLVKRPGQQILADFADILSPFQREGGETVPDLRHPRPNVSVDPAMRGGHPVILGTRVPFELVSGLVEDGVPPEEIVLYFPKVSAAAALDAVDFAAYVAGRAEPDAAA